MTTTGVYLTQLLEDYGVECVFGIPGVHTLELYRGLNQSTIRHITPRHEQGAGFMADGYARVSGKPGVCFIISGPGMTNILTPMGQAYGDSIPMLVISTVNAHGRMGSGDGWLHELPDQRTLTHGVCAFSHTVHAASEIPHVLARAFAIFDGARPRPVHIELPINVISDSLHSKEQLQCYPRLKRPRADAQAVAMAAMLITAAKQPVLLAGGGTNHASEQIQILINQVPMPVVMSVNARGILPHTHPLAVAASASLQPVRTLIEQADVVLAIGTEFGSTDYDFNEDGQFTVPGKLIRIDIDPQQIVRSCIPDLGLVGDAKTTLIDLLDTINSMDQQQVKIKSPAEQAVSVTHKALDKSMSAREHSYIRVLETIRDALPGVVIVGDSTQIIYAGNNAFSASQPGSYFNSATGFGTLGYALPAAIGATLASAQRSVVAIVGDGGLQFTLSELATAIDANSRLTLIVHENGGYVEIKNFMQARAIEPLGVDILIPDIQSIGRTSGWTSKRVDHLSSLPSLLSAASSESAPTLLLLADSLFDD